MSHSENIIEKIKTKSSSKSKKIPYNIASDNIATLPAHATQETVKTQGFASDITDNITQMMIFGQKLTSDLLFSGMRNPTNIVIDPFNAMQSWFDSVASMIAHPEKILESQVTLWQNYAQLCQNTLARFQGEDTPDVISPARSDRRFRSEVWDENIFDFIKQCYLLVGSSVMEAIESTSTDLDKRSRDRALFFTKQFIDALSPSNFLMTNPEVLEETFKTGGANLVKGLQNLVRDFERGSGKLAITQTDYGAFTVGKDLATTEGKVIFRNELIELIQYAPRSETVYTQPLLILPPFINKFYILDMRPENSLIKWIVEQGFTTFVVSWRNPTAEHANYSFEDYIRRGLFAALDAIEEATGEKKTSVVGYCIGGTMMTMALSLMKQRGDNRVGNVTYFASQVDFSDAGELSYFVDKEQIENIGNIMRARGGFLEGHEMADTFNMLRANDLIWSFVVNNYLLGKDPFPFDLLYWNSDTTRMPMRLQLDYLEQCYLNNDLANKRMIIEDKIIDPAEIDIPMYIQASKEDHIAPAESVYRGAKLYAGKVRFMLAGSGHIAGVINHPDNHKYQHWVNKHAQETETPDTFEQWLEGATEIQGSWWNDWAMWLGERSGQRISARMVSEEALMNAPGSYVLEK